MRRLALLLLFLSLSALSALAADITGQWSVKIATPSGQITGVAGFTQHGDTVTGWLGPSEADPISISIAIKGNKLTIWTHPQPGRNVAFARCDVTIGDDKMTGTIDTDKGTIEFVRTEKK